LGSFHFRTSVVSIGWRVFGQSSCVIHRSIVMAVTICRHVLDLTNLTTDLWDDIFLTGLIFDQAPVEQRFFVGLLHARMTIFKFIILRGIIELTDTQFGVYYIPPTVMRRIYLRPELFSLHSMGIVCFYLSPVLSPSLY